MNKGAKRARITQNEVDHANLPGREQLWLVGRELQRIGQKYCDATEVLSLLLAHGLVKQKVCESSPSEHNKKTTCAKTKSTKRTRRTQTKNEQTHQLLLAKELQSQLGKQSCDKTELLPLLLTSDLVCHVLTIGLEVRPLGGDSFKVRLDAAKATVGQAKLEIARVQGTTEARQELYKVATKAGGGAVREDDAEAEPLEDDEMVLGDGEVVAMAVKEDWMAMREVESRYMASASYLDEQPNINSHMRRIVCDWIVEMFEDGELDISPSLLGRRADTSFLITSLIDRYMSLGNEISRANLQAVAVAALLIVAKQFLEEDWSCKIYNHANEASSRTYTLIQFCVWVTDQTYTETHLLTFEATMREALKDDMIATPNAYTFIAHFESTFGRTAGCTTRLIHLTKYIAESMLLEYEMLKYTPSMVAAGSLNLALRAFCTYDCPGAAHSTAFSQDADVWTDALAGYTGYSEAELHQCLVEISTMINSNHESFRRGGRDGDVPGNETMVKVKYSSDEFEGVAALPIPELVCRDGRINPHPPDILSRTPPLEVLF
jgi:cyclin B